MARFDKIFLKLKNAPSNARFVLVCNLAKHVGYIEDGGSGSHQIFKNCNLPDPDNFINLQEGKNGKAKGYQVKKLISIIEEHKLLEESDPEKDKK